MEKEDKPAEVDFDEEADIARKVLKNLLASSSKGTLAPADDDSVPKGNMEPNTDESVVTPDKLLDESAKASEVSRPGKPDKGKETEEKEKEKLQRTIFISNLPFEITNKEVEQRFSSYGEVQSFVPVPHRVTGYVIFDLICICICKNVLKLDMTSLCARRPKGTGFLMFKTTDAATAAISATNVAGIFLKGRQLTVLEALDKKAAHNKEIEKAKSEDHDHRNLYLAKVDFKTSTFCFWFGIVLSFSPVWLTFLNQTYIRKDLFSRGLLLQKVFWPVIC